MTQTFYEWAESEGLDMSVDWKGKLTSPVTAGALRGWEAAQSAGQEAVAWRSSYVDPLTCARVYYVAQTETRARDLVVGRPYIEIEPLGVIAAPVNGGERELGQVIDERDQYHDAADKLAGAIAKHFGVEIGEHSNLNCPWQNALDHIAQATKRAADAQQVGGGEREAFEKWANTKHMPLCVIGQQYDDYWTDNAWNGWQARAALSADGGEAAFNPDLLDFTPTEDYQVADMANVGYTLLQRIAEMVPGYDWNESPTEIVSDLINERDEARAALSVDGGKDKRDAERLDFMIEQQAWVQWTVRDGSIRQCQVYTQDEDENYHILSGEDKFFSTPREAIDAAIAAKAKGEAQ